MVKVQITLSMQQAQILEAALDFYSRIGCGQFNELARECQFIGVPTIDTEKLDDLVLQLKQLVFPHLSATSNIGIMNAQQRYRIACDIHDVLRNKMAWWEKPKGGITVDFDAPFHSTPEIPLPEVKVTDE